MATDMNPVQHLEQLDTGTECRSTLDELRRLVGVRCLKCGSDRVSRIPSLPFQCNVCNHPFSVTTGTVFHESHPSFGKWVLTIHLMVESPKGISANQMKRTLPVSHKTARYLCHRIRATVMESNPCLHLAPDSS